MRSSSIISLLASGLSLVSALPSDFRITHATRSAPPPRGAVRIRSITYGGNGCPQGSLDWQLSDDQGIIPLIFDDFVAYTGGDAPTTERRKFCQLNIALDIPAGYSFSIWQTGYLGYVALDPGTTGTLSTLYYFSGEQNQNEHKTVFRGPLNKDYTAFNTEPMGIYSPCGGEVLLNVRSSVAVSGSGNALMTNDKQSNNFRQFLYLDWRNC
ncbi:hypothetical protein P152DRAFT_414782 [Eremomyces bilateralis CBS 781.70]|uniref:Secreted protein n=1 Tax=Eremomyces bilateralis CBS 781.70 TaxID=1392243 RepID=A0A6G1G5J9_9PEZI|nr:uncharacterized protein P152DRAFT_414782 [Eremomyces bilateralis CBS 781.70]KAF1813109.1 hypothetical protein P152DRAFT_414782 [Eremomyces bilateralis CBS 781.70]